MLYDDKVKARQAMYTALTELNKVVATRPNSINLLNFVQAKLVELKNVYADAEIKDKTEVVNLLKRLDPANASKYQDILN